MPSRFSRETEASRPCGETLVPSGAVTDDPETRGTRSLFWNESEMKSEPKRQKKTHTNQSYYRVQITLLFVSLSARLCGRSDPAIIHCQLVVAHVYTGLGLQGSLRVVSDGS